MQKQTYQNKYKQLNLLGKGNYGKAFRVKLNDGKQGKQAKYFVAKKMFLQGMSEQEIQMAFGQIRILQSINQLNIPFIVSYKEFFKLENQLVILMEFCECGDLTTLIKNLKKNGQRLGEKIISYWFIQLLFGVKALHYKNILHRDLKSANIFLTQNYCLKIGDFGISKILESTSAITCIGTPLYLSPQVCNNQPYGKSSDLWALGCIMYQLCALHYPFEAGNMIVLAKKIVMDEVAPIPKCYSQELNQLIMKMFTKSNKQRITIDQIFNSKYIQDAMKSFIEDQGKLELLATPIDNEEFKKEESIVTAEEQDTMKTINSVVEKTGGNANTLEFSQTLTPSQQRKLRKQEETNKRIAELNKAAKQTATLRNFAKQQKKKALGLTSQNPKADFKKKQLERMMQTENKIRGQNKEAKKKDNVLLKQQNIDLNAIAGALNTLKISEIEFQEVELESEKSYIPLKNNSEKQMLKTQQTDAIQQEIREINSDDQLDQYYDQQFEDYVEQTEEKKQANKEEKNNILNFFENQVHHEQMSPNKKERFQRVWMEDIKPLKSQKKIDYMINECIEKIGKSKFEEFYSKIKAGKLDRKDEKKKYSIYQCQVLHKIDEILYLQKN